MKKIHLVALFLTLAGCQRESGSTFVTKNPPSPEGACFEVGLEYCFKIVTCEEPIKDPETGEPLGMNDITECTAVVGRVCATSGVKLKKEELVRVYDECLPALRASDCTNYESQGELHCPDVETEQGQ